jgi:hypothetical protein
MSVFVLFFSSKNLQKLRIFRLLVANVAMLERGISDGGFQLICGVTVDANGVGSRQTARQNWHYPTLLAFAVRSLG